MRPKVALPYCPQKGRDTSQASPSQGPLTGASLAPGLAAGPALDKALTSFPDCRDRKGGHQPHGFEGRAQPTPRRHACVSNQPHGTGLEMVSLCVQTCMVVCVCANTYQPEHTSYHHYVCAPMSLCCIDRYVCVHVCLRRCPAWLCSRVSMSLCP